MLYYYPSVSKSQGELTHTTLFGPRFFINIQESNICKQKKKREISKIMNHPRHNFLIIYKFTKRREI